MSNSTKGDNKLKKLLEEFKKNYLFNGVGDESIIDFANNYFCKIVEYDANHCIISKDEPSQLLGLVLEGSLGIYSDSQYGDHTIIGIGDNKYLFGFIPEFFDSSRSITSLYCRKYCKVAYFDIGGSNNLLDFIEKINSKIILNIFYMLSIHIRDDFDRMHIISSPYVKVRYIRFLLHRYEQIGSLHLEHLFTRTELANYLGVYRTSLSRIIKKMVEEEIITIKGEKVSINNLEKLISFAD